MKVPLSVCAVWGTKFAKNSNDGIGSNFEFTSV